MARTIYVDLSNSLEAWRQKTNCLSTWVGDLDNLITDTDVTIVDAINSMETKFITEADAKNLFTVAKNGQGLYIDLTYDPSNAVFTYTCNEFEETDIPNLSAAKITTGVFDPLRIPSLNANKINDGVLDRGRIPLLDASWINTGVLYEDRIPSLPASRISASFSETFDLDLLPTIPISKIATSGTILDGCTATAIELNILDSCTASTAELNLLDGCTASTTELNLLDGKTFLDEDDLTSNSAIGIASQQSIKAYVDSEIAKVSNSVANSYLATIVHNENTDSDTITLVLPAGTWMVRADFTYHQTAVRTSTLTIDGDQVLSTPNIGDTAGTSQAVLFGYKLCSGGRTITCSAETSNAYATSRRFMVMAWKTG